MPEWFTVLLLILFGIGIIIIEIIFVPGTTVIGILGFIITGTGICFSYLYFGSKIGHVILGGSFFICIVLAVWAFQSGSWELFSLKEVNRSKSHKDVSTELKIGQIGVCLSDLKPIGRGEFARNIYEVKTLGKHVSSGQKIEIIEIKNNQIIVQLIT